METPGAFANFLTAAISDRGFKTAFDGEVKESPLFVNEMEGLEPFDERVSNMRSRLNSFCAEREPRALPTKFVFATFHAYWRDRA